MEKEKDKIKSFTAVEILVTYVSLGWGLVMLTDSNAFDKSENFSRMEVVFQNEWVVGVICLLLAVTKILGIAIKSTKVREIGLMISTVFWVIVSATFLLSSEGFDLNTGFIVYSAISVMCLWTAKEVVAND